MATPTDPRSLEEGKPIPRAVIAGISAALFVLIVAILAEVFLHDRRPKEPVPEPVVENGFRIEAILPQTVMAGTTHRVPVRLERNGFRGAVSLAVEGIPPSVEIEPVTIGPNAIEGELVVRVDPESPRIAPVIRLVATGEDQRRETVFGLTVRPIPKLTLKLERSDAKLWANGLPQLVTVLVDRRGCEDEPASVSLSSAGLPKGVTVAQAEQKLEPGKDRVTFEFHTATDAPAIESREVRVTATVERPPLQAEVMLPLSVVRPQVRLEVPASVSVTAGQSAIFKVKIDPGEYAGPVRLELRGAPEGVALEQRAVEQIEVEVKLLADRVTLGGTFDAALQSAVGDTAEAGSKLTLQIRSPLLALLKMPDTLTDAGISASGKWITARSTKTTTVFGKPAATATVRVWKADSFALWRGVEGEAGETGVFLSPTARWIITQEGPDTLRVWDGETGTEVPGGPHPGAYQNGVSFSADGSRVALREATGVGPGATFTLKIRDTKTWRELFSHDEGKSVGGVPRLSPDGKRLYVFYRGDGKAPGERLRIWDVTTGKAVHTLEDRESLGLTFDQAGKYLARRWRMEVQVIDASTGLQVRPLQGHSADATDAEYNPDSTRIATGGQDNAIKVWDVETGKEKLTFARHSHPIAGIRWNPTGEVILSWDSGKDSPARLWETATGKELGTFPTSGVELSRWGPDGKQLARVDGTNEVSVWDVRGNKRVRGPFPHRDAIRRIEFSPDGKRLVTASNDGVVKVWDLTVDEAKIR